MQEKHNVYAVIQGARMLVLDLKASFIERIMHLDGDVEDAVTLACAAGLMTYYTGSGVYGVEMAIPSLPGRPRFLMLVGAEELCSPQTLVYQPTSWAQKQALSSRMSCADYYYSSLQSVYMATQHDQPDLMTGWTDEQRLNWFSKAISGSVLNRFVLNTEDLLIPDDSDDDDEKDDDQLPLNRTGFMLFLRDGSELTIRPDGPELPLGLTAAMKEKRTGEKKALPPDFYTNAHLVGIA